MPSAIRNRDRNQFSSSWDNDRHARAVEQALRVMWKEVCVST